MAILICQNQALKNERQNVSKMTEITIKTVFNEVI